VKQSLLRSIVYQEVRRCLPDLRQKAGKETRGWGAMSLQEAGSMLTSTY
jgi:hypothetical protein